MKTRLTTDNAKQWINDPSSAPEDWQGVIKTKKSRILRLVSKGFPIENSDGDMLSSELTARQFQLYVKRSGSVRVYTENKEYTALKKTISLLYTRLDTALFSVEREDSRKAIKALKRVKESLHEYNMKFMYYEEYLQFYSKEIKHWVDMCTPCFYDEFPLAKRKG